MPIKVLFVCLGNICRSPTAEVTFAAAVKKAGLAEKFVIDSAGTCDDHVGHPPDRRAQSSAKARGLSLSHLVARQVTLQDFEAFDYIVAMDKYNYSDLVTLSPKKYHHKISLLLSHLPEKMLLEVPDPYYAGGAHFEEVFDLIEAGSQAFLASLREIHKI